MGRRGPAPTPSAILEARGSWRAKNNPREPRPKVAAPKCPPQLSRAAKNVWKSVASLIAPGVLTIDNAQTLARYCHGLVRWWKLAAWLDENDDIYEVSDQQGNTRFVRHPNVITYEKLGRDLVRIEQEFGLTPSARTRVQAVVNDDQGPAKEEPREQPILKIAQ
jgi:P27 family predicted phage terminase small subunit